jgi:hypothetical protein
MKNFLQLNNTSTLNKFEEYIKNVSPLIHEEEAFEEEFMKIKRKTKFHTNLLNEF